MTGEWAPLTQKERVLLRLQAIPDGVCGTAYLRMRIPRYAARILDLKNDGWWINRVTCPYPDHTHPREIATYKLMGRRYDL